MNPGLMAICKKFVSGKNLKVLESYFSEYGKLFDIKFDFAVIGPEAFIADGFTEFLEERGIPVIAPNKKYGLIETSKIFARNFVGDIGKEKYQPKYKFFIGGIKEEIEKAVEYAYNDLNGNFVVKNNALAGGKGVKLSGEHIHNQDEFLEFVEKISKNGEGFLVEEKLVGKEFSLLSFSDGKDLLHMQCVRDFKKAYEGDLGPNTGGMGTISELNGRLSYLNEEDVKKARDLNCDVVKWLKTNFENDVGKRPGEKERGYIGILYGSYMKTVEGEIKLIEFNCRFGDPEVLNILTNMKTSLLDIFVDIKDRNLGKWLQEGKEIEFEDRYTVCKYLVPKGYPENSIPHYNIYFLDENLIDYSRYDIPIYFASVYEIKRNYEKGYDIYNNNSRCIAYVGVGNSMKEAWNDCENNIKNIVGNMWYRKDIGMEFDNPEDVISYGNSGVNIDEGNKVVEGIKNLMKLKNMDEGGKREDNIGNFGGLFGLKEIKNKKWFRKLNKNGDNGDKGNVELEDIHLVSSIDGVGTKVIMSDTYKGIKGLYNCGKDLVYHGINDILVMGAHPLFFLDYYGCQKLVAEETIEFVRGIRDACDEYGVKLVGGETAEMNTIYNSGMKDLVGVMVGAVANEEILDGSKVGSGNHLYSIKSNGPHTNGYSLIRKIFEKSDFGSFRDEDEVENEGDKENNKKRLAEWCLQNHTCYYTEYEKLREMIGSYPEEVSVSGLCHITGGGFYENLERIVKKDRFKIVLEYDLIENMDDEFKLIQRMGNVLNDEMLRVLNCGIGFVFILDKKIDKGEFKNFGLDVNYLGYIE